MIKSSKKIIAISLEKEVVEKLELLSINKSKLINKLLIEWFKIKDKSV